MSIYQFDHLVHFVDHPLDAMEQLRRIGLHVVEGGRHETYGTYNTLSYFDLSYIEIIGTFDKKLVEAAAGIEHSLRETFVDRNYAEGLTRVAIRTNDIEADAKRFKENGLNVNGPLPLSRRRPDGKLITWRLLYVGTNHNTLELPFFIQWDDEDEDRKEELIDQSVIAEHSNGNLAIDSIGFAVADLQQTVETWTRYFDLEKGDSFIDDHLNASAQTLILKGGNLTFYSPLGEGKVKEVLNQHGEAPFTVDFSGANQKGQFHILGAQYRYI
ncbi:VOC family protein [Bacillus sp. CRN 9]|nr:VOC family protein [Bacillus sp. CRN 9]